MQVPQPIQLTPEECAVRDEITFDLDTLSPNFLETLNKSCSAAGELAKLLLKRNAIPEIRIRYLTDPNFNVGGHGKSRKDIFENHGTKGNAILSHGNFLPYLKYFLFGPDLPTATVSNFTKMVERDEDQEELLKFVRSETRSLPKEKRRLAAEEFFKLAVEVGLDTYDATRVRGAAQTAAR